MKATGIVRRIDDLGRVVIPKEIRRTLRIRESDPLEIFTPQSPRSPPEATTETPEPAIDSPSPYAYPFHRR